MSIARILCIGGSDSGGGAGIQADIKTITMLGGYAMTAITTITAQNTRGVTDILPIPVKHLFAQIEAVRHDIGVDAIKIGMIGGENAASALADYLDQWREDEPDLPLIFDPVMVATSGAVLADGATVAAFKRLIALATLVTPNLPELTALGGEAELIARGATILVKGGHGDGSLLTDRLVGTEGEIARWTGSRIETRHTHGTGCTLASAIACGLGQGMALPDAIDRARRFVRTALTSAPGLGAGHGPMGHHAVRDI